MAAVTEVFENRIINKGFWLSRPLLSYCDFLSTRQLEGKSAEEYFSHCQSYPEGNSTCNSIYF
jgi:hypothetical protein